MNLPTDPLTPFKNDILAIDTNVGYYITPYFHYYGIVGNGEYKIIGPSVQATSNEQTLKELAFQCDVSPDDTADFIIGMKSIVSMPLNSILQILCTMNYIMNAEKLGLENIIIYDSEQQNLKEAMEQERTKYNFNSDIDCIREQQNIHNTLALEQTIVNLVRRGDTAALKEWIADAPAISAGILAADQLRQIKNTFIVTATLIARAAIRGGIDVDDALSLSDAYIQKCELMNNVERITNLQYHMIFDYAERVEKLHYGKQPSKLVRDVSKYIQRHLSEPITTEDIAKALFLSRSRLSVKFKKETNENLIDFILKEKSRRQNASSVIPIKPPSQSAPTSVFHHKVTFQERLRNMREVCPANIGGGTSNNFFPAASEMLRRETSLRAYPFLQSIDYAI